MKCKSGILVWKSLFLRNAKNVLKNWAILPTLTLVVYFYYEKSRAFTKHGWAGAPNAQAFLKRTRE